MGKKVFTTTAASWQEKKLLLTVLETDDIRARRYRAKDVLDKYRVSKVEGGVQFNGSITVLLDDDKVGCSCPDMENRRLPCKHVFAAAAVLGDQEAVLQPSTESPSSRTSPNSKASSSQSKQRSRQRPQDVQVGKYFLLSDFLFSDTALKEGLRNWLEIETEYGQAVLECMNILCTSLLDPLCEEFGRISITRGYLGQDVYARLYAKDKDNWVKGALAHGFQETGGADIFVHRWEGTALELAKHIQSRSQVYKFDFIRVYPNDRPILCVGVGRFKNARTIQEWQPGFRGSITHRP